MHRHHHQGLHFLELHSRILLLNCSEYFFDKLRSLPFFKVYTVGGLFGKATDDFSDTGTLVEKTTFGKKLN